MTRSLTHPATNPDGTCNDQSCPCQQWSSKQEQTTPHGQQATGWIARFPERPGFYWMRGFRQYRTLPVEVNGNKFGIMYGNGILFDVKDAEGAEFFGPLVIPNETDNNNLESTALRNTRSIIHHAEMVEEQARRERCVKCNHSGFVDSRGVCRQFTRESYQPGGSLTCGCECVFPVTATTPEDQRTQTTFEQHWQEAPKSIKHGCEMSSAEFFYHAGRRDRETEMLREVNTVLSGVAQRIGQERLR